MKVMLVISIFSVLTRTSNAEEKCKGELSACLAKTPLEGHKGLPTSLDQVNTLCRSYKLGMECVDKWNKECLPPELRQKAERQMASAQVFMGLLCTDGDFKREYLNHTDCLAGVSKDWDRCNRHFQDAMGEINYLGNRISYTQKTIDLCCARYGFNRCVSMASLAKCTKPAALFLRRISETLSHDSRCDRFHIAVCSSSKNIFPTASLVCFFLAHFILLIVLSLEN